MCCVCVQAKIIIFWQLVVYNIPYHCFASFIQPYFLSSPNGKIILNSLQIRFANIGYLEDFCQLSGN